VVLVLAIDSETPAHDSEELDSLTFLVRSTGTTLAACWPGDGPTKRERHLLRVARGVGNQPSKGDGKSKYHPTAYVHQNIRNRHGVIRASTGINALANVGWRITFRSADTLSLMSNGLHGV